MTSHEVETRPWGKAWVDENGISHVDFVPSTHQTLAIAKEEIEILGIINKGQLRPLLVDLRNVRATDFDARKYFGGPEAKRVWRAAGLVTATPLSNAIGNLWLAAHNTRENPAKLFTSETEALAWLKGFL
jgi:hypothetical protein